MNRIVSSLSVLAIPLVALACGSSSSSANDDGGTAGPTGGGNTLSCMFQLNGFEPQCQFYEATGSDAPRAIAQLRAGCIDQSGAKAKVLDSCPTDKSLGGCKTPVPVKGSTNVQLFITNFEYQPTGAPNTIEKHSTPAQVKSFCTSQGANATYIPAP